MKKSEKRKLRKLNEACRAKGMPALTHARQRPPINVPSAVASVKDEPPSTAFRREPERHPLVKLKEKLRDKLPDAMFEAGVALVLICEKLERTGVDCTAAIGMGGGRSYGSIFQYHWSQEQRDCHAMLLQIGKNLAEWEYLILIRVCGESWPIADAVRAYAICHEDGRTDMFLNCLSQLVRAQKSLGTTHKLYREVADWLNEMRAYGLKNVSGNGNAR